MRLCFHQTGRPADVLKLESFSPAPPERHEVLVRMLYAPVNPADLNFIEGSYGKLPSFPAVPGNEGCGRVEAIGEEVESLAVGDLVLPLHARGTWSEQMVAAENQFARLPADLDPIQASMLRVNPATAWQLLHEYRDPIEGRYVLQNAANSGVGRAVIQIAKKLGLKTVNFVRRPELFAELLALGADGVFLDNEEGYKEARAFLGEHTSPLALNAVGGDSALRLMDLLGSGGALVTYGAMSRRSLKVPNKFLIFKGIEVRGYWLSRWMELATHTEIQSVLRPLAEMMLKGELHLPVERVYPADQYQEALIDAVREARGGKVILNFPAPAL